MQKGELAYPQLGFWEIPGLQHEIRTFNKSNSPLYHACCPGTSQGQLRICHVSICSELLHTVAQSLMAVCSAWGPARPNKARGNASGKLPHDHPAVALQARLRGRQLRQGDVCRKLPRNHPAMAWQGQLRVRVRQQRQGGFSVGSCHIFALLWFCEPSEGQATKAGGCV